jgi:hypothetical protein
MKSPVTSSVFVRDEVVDEDRLVSRVWQGFFFWVRDSLLQLIGGPQIIPQGDLAAAAASLDNNNVGKTVWVPTPYNHLLRWSGTAWAWAPGESGAGYYVQFHASVTPADGWVAANGATVTALRADGTTASVVLANNPGYYLRR